MRIDSHNFTLYSKVHTKRAKCTGLGKFIFGVRNVHNICGRCIYKYPRDNNHNRGDDMDAKSKMPWVKTPTDEGRFPSENERVLAFVRGGFFVVARRRDGHWVVSWNGAVIDHDRPITHWTPLPEEPSSK